MILRYFINILNSTRETKKTQQKNVSFKFRTNFSQIDSHLSLVRTEATQLCLFQKFQIEKQKSGSDSHFASLSLQRTPTLSSIKGILVTSNYLCLNGSSFRNICNTVKSFFQENDIRDQQIYSELFTNNLRYLELSDLYEDHLQFDYENIFKCTQLTNLSLSSNKIDNKTIRSLLLKLPKLENLDISNCIGIAPDDLFHTFKQSQFPSLKTLNLSGLNLKNGHLKKVILLFSFEFTFFIYFFLSLGIKTKKHSNINPEKLV